MPSTGRVTSRVELDMSEINRNINAMPGFVKRAATAALLKHRSTAQNYARANAPWTDQTGNARNGLRATSGTDFLEIVHTMPYGIWLETRWGGRYAILADTIDYTGPKVMDTFQGLLDRYPRGIS